MCILDVSSYVLRSKLYGFGLLAYDNSSDMRLGKTYYSVWDTLEKVTTLEVVLLMTIYPSDSLKHVPLLVIQ